MSIVAITKRAFIDLGQEIGLLRQEIAEAREELAALRAETAHLAGELYDLNYGVPDPDEERVVVLTGAEAENEMDGVEILADLTT